MKKITPFLIVVLFIVIVGEIIYLYLKSSRVVLDTKKQTTQQRDTPQSKEEKTINSVFSQVDRPMPTDQITYFPTPYSTPQPEIYSQIRTRTQSAFDLMRSTSYITKETKLLQEYEGKITEFEFLDEEIPIGVYNTSRDIALKVTVKGSTENPKQFYYSKATKDKILTYDANNNRINLEDIKVGDNIRIKVVYNLMLYPPIPETLEFYKLN